MASDIRKMDELSGVVELLAQLGYVGELPLINAGSVLGSVVSNGQLSVVLGDAERRPLALLCLSFEGGQDFLRQMQHHAEVRSTSAKALRH
jgi:hypothetical protein